MVEESLCAALRHAAATHTDLDAIWTAETCLTYGELHRASDALAAWMIDHRRRDDGLLGIMLPKSAEAVIGIVAALKAKVAYVPVDPGWPERRLESIFRQSQFEFLIRGPAPSAHEDSVPRVLAAGETEWRRILESGDSPQPDAEPAAEESLAYILFTSGSTGDPKGVCVSRRAAAYFPAWARHEFDLRPGDRIASVAPFTFDLSTFDLFSSLAAGACVCLVPEKTRLLPSSLSRFLEVQQITTLYAVPSNLGLLANRGLLHKRKLDAMRTVLFAGEVFPLPLYREFVERMPGGIRYCNLYGPTETNVCTWFDTRELTAADTAMPIGRPLPGTTLLTDPAGAPDEAELCVAGPAVMSGYLGSMDRDDIWLDIGSGKRAYRTGDHVRCRDDGHWLYFGRRDGMVKIWGYRVELGEIESCLLDIDDVQQAAVVKVSASGEFGDALRAFVVTADDSALDERAILQHCKSGLPGYMVPQTVRFLDSMPLSENGKIDRRRLQAMVSEESPS